MSELPFLKNLHVQNPVSHMLKKVQKHELVSTIQIMDNGRMLVYDKMKLEGNWIYDKLKNKKFAYLDKSVDFVVNERLMPGIYRLHILDPMCSSTVTIEKPEEAKTIEGKEASLEPHASVFKFRANSHLVATVIDSNMGAAMFRIKTEMGTLLLVSGLMLCIGLLMGAMVGGSFR